MPVQEGPRNDNRFLMWVGHYSIRIMIPSIAVVVLFYALGQPGGDMGAFSWAVSAVWLLWFVTVILDFNYHEARLCTRCASDTPLDTQAAIKKWGRVLRLFHNKRAIFGFAIINTAWVFFGSTYAGHHWWTYAISVCSYLIIGVLFTTLHKHRQLYPWCPYCGWHGGGGDEEVVPDPAPSTTVS